MASWGGELVFHRREDPELYAPVNLHINKKWLDLFAVWRPRIQVWGERLKRRPLACIRMMIRLLQPWLFTIIISGSALFPFMRNTLADIHALDVRGRRISKCRLCFSKESSGRAVIFPIYSPTAIFRFILIYPLRDSFSRPPRMWRVDL